MPPTDPLPFETAPTAVAASRSFEIERMLNPRTPLLTRAFSGVSGVPQPGTASAR
jgi:hypothetical protein